MKKNNLPNHSKDKVRTAKGFTFLEILIALLILGSSITIIYGLQTASVSAAIHDSQLQKAILIARSIMSQIESIEDTVENVNKSGTAFSVLDSINAAVPDKVLMKELETFQTDLTIEYWNIPGIEEIPKSSLRRVNLVVSWGDTERDKAHFYYFIPKEPDSQ